MASKRVVCAVATALMSWLLAPEARAAPAFEIGGRLGYGHAFGEVGEGDDLDEGVLGQFPIWLDLGVRVAPGVSVGAFGSFGPGLLGTELDDACDDVADNESITDCSTRVWDLRLGAQAAFHFASSPNAIDPWVGIGVGYEWLTLDAGVEGIENGERVEAELTATLRGFELASLQAGLDFPISAGAWLGPFLAYTAGRYDIASMSCEGDCGSLESQSEEFDDKALHHWLFLGVRLVALP